MKVVKKQLPVYKKCNDCGDVKQIHEFYPRRTMIGDTLYIGRMSCCISCHREKVTARRDKDKYLQYQKQYRDEKKRTCVENTIQRSL